MTCEAIRQNDEMFCARCNLRWETNSVGLPCPKNSVGDPPPRGPARRNEGDSDRVLRIAKAIVGPHSDLHIGRQQMLRLREHKWRHLLSDAERHQAYNAAEAVLAELKNHDGPL